MVTEARGQFKQVLGNFDDPSLFPQKLKTEQICQLEMFRSAKHCAYTAVFLLFFFSCFEYYVLRIYYQ